MFLSEKVLKGYKTSSGSNKNSVHLLDITVGKDANKEKAILKKDFSDVLFGKLNNRLVKKAHSTSGAF